MAAGGRASARSRSVRACRTIAAVVLLASPAWASDAPRTANPYLPSLSVDGMVFPVARSKWYSVINFEDDWHAPRMRLVGGKWRQVGVHEGNDIFAEPKTPVRAVLGGRVERLGWTFYSGWRVGIRGDDGRYWFYAHLRSFRPGLGVGERVESGSEIGQVGNTGYGADPGHADEFTYHLHLGIQEASGRWVNPYPLLERLYRATVEAQR